MELSKISLACLPLDSSSCNDIACGSNGLPITPNSIKIIGEFKACVEHVNHPNLINYVDCFRNKNGKCSLDQSFKTLTPVSIHNRLITHNHSYLQNVSL